MFKVMVVDDEEHMRERLAVSFPWKELGFSLIDFAKDGAEAWEKIKSNPPDVAVVDIMMPVMNGLELTRRIHEQYPHMKTILLSAYDDFKFAQDAIRYGVKGYLLKPVMREEFRNVLSGITEELRKDRSLREIEDHAEPLLIRLLKGIGLEQAKTDEQLAYFGLEGLAHYNRVIVWSSDQLFHTEARPLLQQAVLQRAKQYEKSLTPMLLYGNRLVMIVNSIHPISKSDLYLELIKKRAFLMNEMESLGICSQGVTVGVGNLVHGWQGIAQSYGEAVYAGSFHSIHRSDEVLFRQDLGTDIKETHNEPLADVMNTMVDCVIHKELDRIQANTTIFFRRLESRERYRMVDVRMHCAEVMFLLDLRIKEIHPDMPGFNKAEALEKVLQASTLIELKQWFAEQLERASLQIKRLSRVAPNRYVMEAKQFVDTHYAEKIRLEDMAETMHLNAKYFSSLFKKESGMNFIDYVNEVRIRKASELIFGSDHMINEIAYMVGFQNLSHFNKLFRKATSMTPLAYRIRVRIE